MRPPAGQRRIGRRIAGFLLVVLAAGAAYAFIPRKADLTAFDPAAMAHAETLMWRHYYDKRYVPLFLELYRAARNERNFSPWDSLRIAVFAAGAARTFQPSTSRAGADAALPPLARLFPRAGARREGSGRHRTGGAHRTRLVAGAARGREARAIRTAHRAGLDTALRHRQRGPSQIGRAARAGDGIPRCAQQQDDRGR